MFLLSLSPFFFFNATATTEIYTLSLHDALPISTGEHRVVDVHVRVPGIQPVDERRLRACRRAATRSEEHTSELQSQSNLVCRLLLEKKKKKKTQKKIHNIIKEYFMTVNTEQK